FARSRIRFRSDERFLPARLMKNTSIDMAERKGSVLRLLLRSAERFNDSATARGLVLLKTPSSRSSALLVAVTRPDQSRPPPASPLRALEEGVRRDFVRRARSMSSGDASDIHRPLKGGRRGARPYVALCCLAYEERPGKRSYHEHSAEIMDRE